MLVCVFFALICTRDRGCSVHPAFPAPSFFEGKDFSHNPGAARRGNAEVCLAGLKVFGCLKRESERRIGAPTPTNASSLRTQGPNTPRLHGGRRCGGALENIIG